jgi:hypothetical protein
MQLDVEVGFAVTIDWGAEFKSMLTHVINVLKKYVNSV